MAYPELRLLGRWTRSASALGSQGALTVWSPPPVLTTSPNLPQGKLNGKQVGAVAYVVVHPPVNGTTYEDLARVQLVLDGQPYPWVWYHGRKDLNMAPDPTKVRVGSILYLGDPPYDEINGPADPLNNTAPKFIDSVTVNCWAGSSAITQDYTVEVWGWVYDSVKLAGLMPVYSPGNVTVADVTTGRTFTAAIPAIPAQGDWRGAWTSLPGGPQQGAGGGTPIYPLVRRAKNANATVPSQAYVPQYENSSQTPAVEFATDNLYFNLNARQALLIKRMGFVGPVAPNSGGYDLLSAWLETPQEGEHERHPNGGIPADYQLGRTKFGLVPGTSDRYAGVPELETPILVTNEIAYPTVVDNGVSVPALAIAFALVGVYLGPAGQGGI